jgi:SAM-dependent methyltransferase
MNQMGHGYAEYTQTRITHWNDIAKKWHPENTLGEVYFDHIKGVYRYLIPTESNVLEIGCGKGDLLASLSPQNGVGIDFSEEMITQAQKRHPELTFYIHDAHFLDLGEQFDYIVISDLVGSLWDVKRVFERIRPLCKKDTRIILNFYSYLWEYPLRIAEKFKLVRPKLEQNWMTVDDVNNLLFLSGFERIYNWEEFLWPFKTIFLGTIFNRYLSKIWPFRLFCVSHFIVARSVEHIGKIPEDSVVSVIVAARNEAGNIKNILERVPEMGKGTELIFVEGGSNDDTYKVIEKAIKEYPEKNVKLFSQSDTGKGDAVRLGFEKASGDILMILDADLTVPPEYLHDFYEAVISGKGEFINGVRLVYPMENSAMRFFNLVGNKFFSFAFSWLLGRPVKDTLCGTKVLAKHHYDLIVANRSYFGEFDPFGDFDLLFGAAKLKLKIIDLPIRYCDRLYGDTNISRWRHGLILLKMVIFAMHRMKFIPTNENGINRKGIK